MPPVRLSEAARVRPRAASRATVLIHGETGTGGLEIGAPSFTDEAVIYGQDRETVMETLRRGRHGVMPAWSGRLSEAEINLLALYVARLGRPEGGGQ